MGVWECGSVGAGGIGGKAEVNGEVEAKLEECRMANVG